MAAPVPGTSAAHDRSGSLDSTGRPVRNAMDAAHFVSGTADSARDHVTIPSTAMSCGRKSGATLSASSSAKQDALETDDATAR